MRKKITALAAAGILLFAACSGDDDDDAATDTTQADGSGGGDAADDNATDSPDANASDDGGGGGGGGFCDEAGRLFETTSGMDPEEQLDAAEALEPPDEIADDWNRLIEGSRQAAEDAADFDPNDPGASEEFQQQYDDLMDATTNVYTYLGEECGLEGFTPPAGGGGEISVPTTSGG
jgi:hypothetical protein